MPDRRLWFAEDEVALILWVLADAREMADQLDALSTLVLLEETFGMVRRRFDDRGQEYS